MAKKKVVSIRKGVGLVENLRDFVELRPFLFSCLTIKVEEIFQMHCGRKVSQDETFWVCLKLLLESQSAKKKKVFMT